MKDFEKAYWFGVLAGIIATAGIVFLCSSKSVCAQVPNWDSSPYNFKNSDLNYDNSSYKWGNSPYKFENSPYDYNSRIGVYTNSGDRLGYETISPSGVQNYFDDSGNRRGYRGER